MTSRVIIGVMSSVQEAIGAVSADNKNAISNRHYILMLFLSFIQQHHTTAQYSTVQYNTVQQSIAHHSTA